MVSQTLTDHVLRTLAAVPPPERVLVVGEGVDQLRSNLSSLGFESVHERTGAFDAAVGLDDSFGWGVLVMASTRTGTTLHLLSRLRPRIRSGGWVIVGMEGVPDSEAVQAAGGEMLAGLSAMGFALAEPLTRHEGGYHVILRRVDDGTVG